MTDRELMQMALDALDTLGAGTSYKTHNTAKALRDRLAQPEPVHAIDISQERVDETAKREHEPWQSVQCTCGGIIYFKHTKREWVGLTDDEIIKCFDSVAFGQVEDDLIINKHVNIFRAIHFIEAKLKEKNT
jgi:hypothetical protein